MIRAGETLWDLSSDVATAQFMSTHGILALALHPLTKPTGHGTRLLEVCTGLVANVVAVDEVARDELLRRRPDAASSLCSLLVSIEDSSVLSELLRLLSVLIHHAAVSPAVGCKPQEEKAPTQAAATSARQTWLVPLTSPECLSALVFFITSTLRPGLLSRAASLVSTLLYFESELVSATLVQIAAPPALNQLIVTQCAAGAQAASNASATPEDDVALRALLTLCDGLVAALAPAAFDSLQSQPPVAVGSSSGDSLSGSGGSGAFFPVELFHALTHLAACKPVHLLVRAAALKALDSLLESGEAQGSHGDHAPGRDRAPPPDQIYMAPKLLLAALHMVAEGDLSPAVDPAGAHEGAEEEAAGAVDARAVDFDALRDGVTASWSLLHACADRLDGFALCLPSEAQAVHSSAFATLITHAWTLRRGVAAAQRAEEQDHGTSSPEGEATGLASVARSTVTALLAAADVVVTSGNCGAALRGAVVDAGGEAGDEDEFVSAGFLGGSAGADAVLRALNVLRPCVSEAAEDGEQSDESSCAPDLADGGDEHYGFVDGMVDGETSAFYGGDGTEAAVWASSSDEEERTGPARTNPL